MGSPVRDRRVETAWMWHWSLQRQINTPLEVCVTDRSCHAGYSKLHSSSEYPSYFQVLWVEAAVHSEAPCEIRPEHPPPKLVTDNLDNFSNRGDRHRLSIPSTPQDRATPTLSGAPTLPCQGYRSYRSYQLPKPTKEESHENRF
jgi:hypothetical protein